MIAEADENDVLDVKRQKPLEPPIVKFRFSNEGYTCDFGVCTIEDRTGNKNLVIPKRDYKNEFSLPTIDFRRIVRDMLIIGDSVEIDVNKNGVVFTCDSDGNKGRM